MIYKVVSRAALLGFGTSMAWGYRYCTVPKMLVQVGPDQFFLPSEDCKHAFTDVLFVVAAASAGQQKHP